MTSGRLVKPKGKYISVMYWNEAKETPLEFSIFMAAYHGMRREEIV